jgi:hypothetical protein
MNRKGYNIKSYESALNFLGEKGIVEIDSKCVIFKMEETISIILEGREIVKYHSDGRIEVNNFKNYNLRFKRYISEFVPVKLKQKDFQWYLGEKIFFSQMIFENNEWRKV